MGGNRWKNYTNKERMYSFVMNSMDFVKQHPECRSRVLSDGQLRFLLMLQHLVTEDTDDLYRPETERKHGDTFEGVQIEQGVNTQLIKDAHRSEWSIEGRPFSSRRNLVRRATSLAVTIGRRSSWPSNMSWLGHLKTIC